MTCAQAKPALPLYYYGELPPEQEESVEAHCAECEPCTRDLRHYRHLAHVIDEAELEPSLGLLSECRELLAHRVAEWEQPATAHNWWRKAFDWHVDFRIPVGAIALLAAGWFSAKLTSTPSNNSQLGMISLVRSVEPAASGRVQIAVDDVQRRIVSGGIEDRNIRALLLAAAREESNPGVRVESVDVLSSMASAADVRAALLDSVEHDPNPGVRVKALEGLKQFAQDATVRKGLTRVLLNDADPGVRLQVIDLLVGTGADHDDAIVGVLQNLVRKEPDTYVRVRLQNALLEMNASAGTF